MRGARATRWQFFGWGNAVDGLLLHLLDDKLASPGVWFWPWFGPPAGFVEEREMAEYDGLGETSVGLWRPGAVGRWAHTFCEEHIELWATRHGDDPSQAASEFAKTFGGGEERFIEGRAAFWLIYTKRKCWEVFSRDRHLLDQIASGVCMSQSIHAHRTESTRRNMGFQLAGLAGPDA